MLFAEVERPNGPMAAATSLRDSVIASLILASVVAGSCKNAPTTATFSGTSVATHEEHNICAEPPMWLDASDPDAPISCERLRSCGGGAPSWSAIFALLCDRNRQLAIEILESAINEGDRWSARVLPFAYLVGPAPKLEEAVKAFDAALVSWPFSEELILGRGKALMYLGVTSEGDTRSAYFAQARVTFAKITKPPFQLSAWFSIMDRLEGNVDAAALHRSQCESGAPTRTRCGELIATATTTNLRDFLPISEGEFLTPFSDEW
jgi:hypothetical protein